MNLDGGRLKISKSKLGNMDSATRLVYPLIPEVRLTGLLVEVDSWCGYSDRFAHLKTGDDGRL